MLFFPQGFEFLDTMETTVLNLQSLYDNLRTHVDLINENIEPSKLFMASVFELFCHTCFHLLYKCLLYLQFGFSLKGFIQMVQNFEDCRRKWVRTLDELGSCKEMLRKAEMERGALDVKLKHARNQVDVEIRRRQKAEAECETLVWLNANLMFYGLPSRSF